MTTTWILVFALTGCTGAAERADDTSADDTASDDTAADDTSADDTAADDTGSSDTSDSGAANVAPVLADIEPAALTWSVGGGPQAVTSTITARDDDDDALAGAIVTIAVAYQQGYDTLALPAPPADISATWDEPSATLTITGAAAVSAYEDLLRSVVFDNTGAVGMNGAPRTVAFTVYDGADWSDEASRRIEFNAR